MVKRIKNIYGFVAVCSMCLKIYQNKNTEYIKKYYQNMLCCTNLIYTRPIQI